MAAQTKNFDLIIKGFKSKSQVMEFIKWYEGQGEQDASLWFEEAREQGRIGVDFMPVDLNKTYVETSDNVTIWVDPR